ncbi:ABC transporter ATP-binding protein [Bradyrhizobium barranii]|uniref:ABC transporter ATP-binding protein n=1 Tax=Bradyrhizobium barranii TaxID=2992140 RepID=UPI0024AF17BA|nr:ABC transporter ATP-binding protein [Bradyrhizobium barranii]WFT93518.1 ABC transporter ATP-binding protein [Bradyrhizobium barranii]
MTNMKSASQSKPVLDVQGLEVSFLREGQWRSVVRNVSFDVKERETVAVVGESGSGKSVSSMSIMGLIPQSVGRVRGSAVLDGRQLLGLPESELKKIRGRYIAMIFQEPMTSLNPVLSIGFQLCEALMTHRSMSREQAEAEAVRLMDKVRIPAAKARLQEYPHRFSGGMRQRVMIAMALACKPKLLIADEPTTALDVTIQAEILELIRSLQSDDGMSVLFITHDMGVVAEIADRTVVMFNGELIEKNATEAIFEHPAHPYTKALLSAVPRLGSMKGRARPMRFPTVDKVTGASDVPAETTETVKQKDRPVLEVSNLTTRFDVRSGLFGKITSRVHAVEGISFSMLPGETLSLVGESGCGKSTTGRSILRLNQPKSGSIMIDGQDVSKLKGAQLKEMRHSVQSIFQDPFASLNPRLSIGRSIAEPLAAYRKGSSRKISDRVSELLEKVGLEADMSSRYPHEFSGGQRQRICIARALALQPKIVIADEAVSALDVSIKAQVINLMLDLQAEMKLSYLFISHDMAVVERVSHRVAVMYLGEIVEIGPRSAVFENPVHPYTRRLLAAVPVPDPRQRHMAKKLAATEIKSPVRSPDYEPPRRTYREVSPGHSVQVWGEEWERV